LQPKDGIIRLAGPAPSVVIAKLLVEKATVDADRRSRSSTRAARTRRMARARVELSNAETELGRMADLFAGPHRRVVRDAAQLKVDVAKAISARRASRRPRYRARRPRQVVAVHARSGDASG
jgi:hypothetical protein